MRIEETTAYSIWKAGNKVAENVPEIAPEIRGAISVVQNPVELTEAQVKYSLSEILRICKERSKFLSAVNTKRLYRFFNSLSRVSGMSYSVELLYGMTIYYHNSIALSYTGIMKELNCVAM